MVDVQDDVDKGFLLKANGGSDSTYFCDNASLDASCVAYFGGSWSNGANAGAFGLRVYYSASFSNSYFGSRLMYV